MASAIYPLAKQKFLSGAIDLTTDTIKAALVDTGTYTYSGTDEFLDDLSGVATSSASPIYVTIDNKSVTNGVFDTSDDTDTFTAVDAGNNLEAIVVFKDTGTPATSPLICFIDGFTAVTPNGGDITVDWDDGTTIDGIFSL